MNERECGIIKNYDILLITILCAFETLLYAGTEVMSVFHMLNRTSVCCFWGFLLFSFGVAVIVLYGKSRINLSAVKVYITNAARNLIGMRMCIVLLCIVLVFISLNVVPFNNDSLMYHLARVENWIQNKSVSYYPTNDIRQLVSPPLSEYAILHLRLILGNDYAANLVQTVAYILSIVFLEMICRKIKLSDGIIVLCLAMFATMPIAIAESITTQVDLVGTMWLLAFLVIVLDILYFDKYSINSRFMGRLTLCGLTMGFAYMTKSSICMSMMVICIWAGIVVFMRANEKRVATISVSVLISGGVALLVSLPQLIRNKIYIGDYLAHDYMGMITIGTFSPKYVLINVLKNWVLLSANHFDRDLLVRAVDKTARLMGVNIEDSAISLTAGFYNYLPVSYHCDLANCWIPSTIFFFCIIGYAVLFVKKKCHPEYKGFLFTLMLGIFVGMIVIRYQIWGGRLLMPYATLMCIFDATVLESLLKNCRGSVATILPTSILSIITIVVLATAIPAVRYQGEYMVHYWRSHDRFRMCFASNEEYDAYNGVCDYVESLDEREQIGLCIHGAYEYPFWVRLKDENTELIQVIHTDKYLINRMSSQESDLDCIIEINSGGDKESFTYNGMEYRKTYDYSGDGLYVVYTR